MVATATRRVALFSIKPEYATAILDGSKQVEFRRTNPSADITHLVIYATAPVMRIVGVCEVEGVDRRAPSALWAQYAPVGGIERSAYDVYFSGCSLGVAIRVQRPVSIGPRRLADLGEAIRPPQSFQYLNEEAVRLVDAWQCEAARLPEAAERRPTLGRFHLLRRAFGTFSPIAATASAVMGTAFARRRHPPVA